MTATDPDDALAWVRLYYLKPGAAINDTPYTAEMFEGPSHVWTATLQAYSSWVAGTVTYWVRAQDAYGNTTNDLFYTDNYQLDVVGCIF